MTDTKLVDRTLALAGLAQSAQLVQGLARKGKIDQHYLELSVHSLFAFNANSVSEVYGDASALSIGLKSLTRHFFKPKSPEQAEIMRYAFQLIQLAKKVQQSGALSQDLATRLQAVSSQHETETSAIDLDVINAIADIYLKTISPVKPRVIVSGEQGYLAQPETASKVRVCLLCGLRSAHLWLQKGGSKLQLLTARKSYQNQAAMLLTEMAQP